MPIPDFQSLMLPMLRMAADRKEHLIRDAVEILANEFAMDEKERRQLLPSGTQATFDNRVHWARSYLKQAGLVANPRRGVFKITSSGEAVLKSAPTRIDSRFLEQFPEFKVFRARKEAEPQPDRNPDLLDPRTPREMMEFAHQRLREELATELRSAVSEMTPARFERLVVELLVAMGYGGSLLDAGQAIGGSGDEGIDGIIKQDRLGLDVIYVQAKRWQASVGRPEIQKFAGALQGQRARKGVFITTSEFSPGAIEFTQKIDSRIILIDGDALAQLMIDFSLGVASVATYEVKRLDSDFFDDD